MTTSRKKGKSSSDNKSQDAAAPSVETSDASDDITPSRTRSESEEDDDGRTGSVAPHEQVELQNEIMHMLIGMPEMARALVRNTGPCSICLDKNHPSLRCSLLSERNLSPVAHKRLQKAKARFSDPSNSDTIYFETGSSSSSLEYNSEEALIRKKLSTRACHLPGNSWCQDFLMYITNNHLLFGIFCHNKLHPVKVNQRVTMLFGSVAFGLVLTNFTYLYYLLGGGEIIERTVLSFSIGAGAGTEEQTTKNELKIDITQGMAILWTVGAASHSLFDFLLWHMIACGCIKRNCCRVVGWKVALSIVMLLVFLTSSVVLYRAYDSMVSLHRAKDSENAETTLVFHGGQGDFDFMYGYLVELVLSLFVFTPLTQTVVFTGILGCGKLPFLGGRSYELSKCSNDESECENDELEGGKGAESEV